MWHDGPGWRRLSCGVVIVNDDDELLLCRVTGQGHWDLPKGGADPGETPLQAALRETYEETGLRLPPAALLELGRYAYTARTDLHLYATHAPQVDPRALVCHSHYVCADSGQRRPEMDAYGWFAFDAVPLRCRPRLASVLVSRLDLRALRRRLHAAGRAQAQGARPASSSALPPAAAVLTLSVCSLQKR